MTIDEHLCRYRSKCNFRQYLPSKPDKYSIKVWVIADSLNYYHINLEVYLGKHQKQSNKTEDVVLRLAAKLRPGHCLVGDNYFTSLKLCETLSSDKSNFYYGTNKSILREVPNVLSQLEGIPQYSSKVLFYRENTLVSNIRKKNSNVLLLSNVHHNTEIVETEKKKPRVIHDYNLHKSGVDKLDQMMKEHRPYRSTRRWPSEVSLISSHLIFKLPGYYIV